jgi:hypothetical protein
MTALARKWDNSSPPEPIVDRRVELLAIRAAELAERVNRGGIGFIDAVDMAYSAACWSGLCDDVGDDNVQKILAAAFGGIGEDRR